MKISTDLKKRRVYASVTLQDNQSHLMKSGLVWRRSSDVRFFGLVLPLGVLMAGIVVGMFMMLRNQTFDNSKENRLVAAKLLEAQKTNSKHELLNESLAVQLLEAKKKQPPQAIKVKDNFIPMDIYTSSGKFRGHKVAFDGITKKMKDGLEYREAVEQYERESAVENQLKTYTGADIVEGERAGEGEGEEDEEDEEDEEMKENEEEKKEGGGGHRSGQL
jgi:hypothetical protein